jgi:hypothetical protein
MRRPAIQPHLVVQELPLKRPIEQLVEDIP